jgi:MPBQ/MSBQ methyltransferase
VLDQSDHQLAKAKAKPNLEGCTFLTGDAEDLPFADGAFDRYVSCGSIEYWPEPQRGIAEAYRVVREGGTACVVGPVRPTYALSRAMADLWMLFPEEDEYLEWFKCAGFENVKLTRIGPKWYRGERGHGLIMGCSVTGVRPLSGKPPLDLGPKREDRSRKGPNPLASLLRLFVGTIGGLYYFLVPIYMWLKDKALTAAGQGRSEGRPPAGEGSPDVMDDSAQ